MKKENILVSSVLIAAFAFLFFGSQGDRKEKYKIDPAAIVKGIHKNR
jgi:hypothetical protein